MSNSLHVAKKYEVHYATFSSFKNREQVFENLLNYLDIDYAGSFPENFEIYKEHWQDGIDQLKAQLQNAENGIDIDGDLKGILLGFDVYLPELIKIMEDFLQESDPNNDYMILTFF